MPLCLHSYGHVIAAASSTTTTISLCAKLLVFSSFTGIVFVKRGLLFSLLLLKFFASSLKEPHQFLVTNVLLTVVVQRSFEKTWPTRVLSSFNPTGIRECGKGTERRFNHAVQHQEEPFQVRRPFLMLLKRFGWPIVLCGRVLLVVVWLRHELRTLKLILR